MNEYNSPLWKPKTQHISKPCPKESGLPSTSTKQSSELTSQKEDHNQPPKLSNLDH
jgi:hypothetical protein